MNYNIVAIDGPAGAGKSSVAKALAHKLGYSYLDTGAMYRALTVKCLKQGTNLENEDEIVKVAQDTNIDLKFMDDGFAVYLDGEDVSDDVRSTEITNKTFYIARAPKVRSIMVKWQREIAGHNNIVAEGRDIGTVVFPDAQIKFYLDADVNERVQRRMKDLKDKGQDMDPEELLEDIKTRDNHDTSREVGPLKQAEDAIYLDSSGFSVDDTVEAMLKEMNHG